jgi:hypothetical protein
MLLWSLYSLMLFLLFSFSFIILSTSLCIYIICWCSGITLCTLFHQRIKFMSSLLILNAYYSSGWIIVVLIFVIFFTSKYVQANFINQESNFTTIRTNFECMIYQLLVLIIKYKIYLFIHAYGVLFVFCGNRVKEN